MTKNQANEQSEEVSASAIKAELMLAYAKCRAMGIETSIEELRQFQHYLEEKQQKLIGLEKEGYWVIKQQRIEMLESELTERKISLKRWQSSGRQKKRRDLF